MTKAELVEAAMNLDVKPGDGRRMREKQRKEHRQFLAGASNEDREAALSEWCPPSQPPAPKPPMPKKRVKPLPPARAACGTLMDGDRLAAHVSQCSACVTAGARVEVSGDGAIWMTYTGTVEGVDVYRHVRCVATTPARECKAPDWCGIHRRLGDSRDRHYFAWRGDFVSSETHLYCSEACRDGADAPATSEPGRAVTDHVCGNGCAVCDPPAAHPAQEAAKTFPCQRCGNPTNVVGWCSPCWEGKLQWLATQKGTPSKQSGGLIDRRLVHSFGVEDPALPDV